MKEYINKVIAFLWPHRHFLGGAAIGTIFNFVVFEWHVALLALGAALAILILVILFKVK